MRHPNEHNWRIPDESDTTLAVCVRCDLHSLTVVRPGGVGQRRFFVRWNDVEQLVTAQSAAGGRSPPCMPKLPMLSAFTRGFLFEYLLQLNRLAYENAQPERPHGGNRFPLTAEP